MVISVAEDHLFLQKKPIHGDLSSEVEFSWTEAKKAADVAVFSQFSKHLSDIEIKVLDGSWQGKTYEDMAVFYGYSAEYLNKDIGNKLWKKLSDALGERVTKRNFREALRRSWQEPHPHDTLVLSAPALTFPEGAVALNSPFYVERSDERLCYQTVRQPGALIRIKAPRLMGKTSLINRILAYAENQIGRSVYLNLGSCDRAILTNLDKFLRRLCVITGQQLGLENCLKDHWDTDILGSNDNCTAYFEEYLLPELNSPLVLGLDEIDRLFAYPEVAEDFLGMVRSWHEKGKVSPLWQQLRVVIAHSTEVYIPLDINQSPFNAGLPVELPEFNGDQVKQLAKLYGLSLSEQQINDLMQMVEGHPYLIRLALYTLCTQDISLEQMLKMATTESGLYNNHMRRHMNTLEKTARSHVFLTSGCDG